MAVLDDRDPWQRRDAHGSRPPRAYGDRPAVGADAERAGHDARQDVGRHGPGADRRRHRAPLRGRPDRPDAAFRHRHPHHLPLLDRPRARRPGADRRRRRPGLQRGAGAARRARRGRRAGAPALPAVRGRPARRAGATPPGPRRAARRRLRGRDGGAGSRRLVRARAGWAERADAHPRGPRLERRVRRLGVRDELVRRRAARPLRQAGRHRRSAQRHAVARAPAARPGRRVGRHGASRAGRLRGRHARRVHVLPAPLRRPRP